MADRTGRELARGIALTSVTPLTDDGAIDVEGIHNLIQFFLDKGISGDNGFLVPNSTTGNFLALTTNEKKTVVSAFCEACDGRIPVAIGCNATRMDEIVEIAQYAQENGAFAIMVSPPFYWKPTPAQIIAHYRQICESIDIGVILYNNHWATQYDLDPPVLDKLLVFENVIALKESTYSIPKLREIIRLYKDRINILNGLGEPAEPIYAQMGCAGFTSFTIGNVLPAIPVRLYELMTDRDFTMARRLANRVAPLDRFMGGLGGGQYIAAALHMLARFGVSRATVRPPLIPIQEGQLAELENIVAELQEWAEFL